MIFCAARHILKAVASRLPIVSLRRVSTFSTLATHRSIQRRRARETPSIRRLPRLDGSIHRGRKEQQEFCCCVLALVHRWLLLRFCSFYVGSKFLAVQIVVDRAILSACLADNLPEGYELGAIDQLFAFYVYRRYVRILET